MFTVCCLNQFRELFARLSSIKLEPSKLVRYKILIHSGKGAVNKTNHKN